MPVVHEPLDRPPVRAVMGVRVYIPTDNGAWRGLPPGHLLAPSYQSF